jgi:sigma-B regulation protein RsbU (phosphoserine phosphatase)
MKRKVFVVVAAAAQLVVFTSLVAWTVAEWQRIGWTGLSFNQKLSEEAERASQVGPFRVGSQEVAAIAPRSPSADADIREGDRVVSVNAIEIDDLEGLRRLDGEARVGDAITYRLQRDGNEHEIAVGLVSPFTSPFVVANMASTAAVGLIWLLISLLVFWSRPRARTANVFFLLASAGAALYLMWAAGELLWPNLRGIVPTALSIRSWLFFGAVTLLSLAFVNLLLHLALVFPKPRPVVLRWPKVFVWIHTLPFLLFVGLGAMVGSARLSRSVPGLVALEMVLGTVAITISIRLVRAVRREGWTTALRARPLAVQVLLIAVVCHLGLVIRLLPDTASVVVGVVIGLATMIYLLGCLTVFSVLTCVSLYRSYRESGVDVQRQVRWPLWGTVTAVAASVVIVLFSIGIGFLSQKLGISAYTFTTVTNTVTKAVYLLIPLSFAFAILKYRLLDIDVIIRKTVIYSGVTGIVLALYLLLAGLSGGFLVRVAGLKGETATIITTLTVVALFVPIRNRVQGFVDRRFFQRERDLERARRAISALVLGDTRLDEVLPAIADEVQRGLQCRNVALFVLAPDGRDYRLEASVGLADERFPDLRLPRSGATEAPGTKLLPVADNEVLRSIRAAMAAVPSRGGDALGVVSVGSRLDGEPFDAEDGTFLEAAADQLSLAVGRSRQHRAEAELSQAREIQRSLLPSTLPEIGGVKVAARWQPAREVSGDYYDVLRLDERRLALCVGDVVGKGMPAALLMSSLQASLKAVAVQTPSPGEVCSRVRQVMLGSLQGGTFVTFFYGVLDRGAGRFSYCNAGHNPPLLVREDGTIIHLDVGGPIFARITSDRPFQEASVIVGPGDRIVLYTDGVTEALDAAGEMFGEQRLEDALLRCRSDSANEIERNITAAVLEHAHDGLQDDLTLVVAAIL